MILGCRGLRLKFASARNDASAAGVPRTLRADGGIVVTGFWVVETSRCDFLAASTLASDISPAGLRP